jgi:hypothetical protein
MLEQNTTKITVASETTKSYMLRTSIFISREKVMIQILVFEPSANHAGPEALTNTILVRGLLIEFSQTQIIVAIHRFLGAKNVVTVTFNRPKMIPLDAMMEWPQLDASMLRSTRIGVIAVLSPY